MASNHVRAENEARVVSFQAEKKISPVHVMTQCAVFLTISVFAVNAMLGAL